MSAVEGDTAELTKGHLGERDAVLYLRDVEVGRVQPYVYAQPVGPRGDSFPYHLVYVVVKFLHQVAVLLCQLLLFLQGNGYPVRIVHSEEDVLPFQFYVVGSHLLANRRHVVGCLDGPAHVDGLREEDAPCVDILRVGAESVAHRLPDVVAGLCERRDDRADDGCELLRCLGTDKPLLCQSTDAFAYVAAQLPYRIRPDAGEGILLFVAEQGYFAREMLVACQSVYARQVLGLGCPVHVGRHIGGETRYFQLPVVGEGKLPAPLKRIDSLCRQESRYGKRGKHGKEYGYFLHHYYI